jgi:hypothetical protein
MDRVWPGHHGADVPGIAGKGMRLLPYRLPCIGARWLPWVVGQLRASTMLHKIIELTGGHGRRRACSGDEGGGGRWTWEDRPPTTPRFRLRCRVAVLRSEDRLFNFFLKKRGYISNERGSFTKIKLSL